MGRRIIFNMGDRKIELRTKSFLFHAIRLRKMPRRTEWTSGLRKKLFPYRSMIEDRNSERFVAWVIRQLKSTGIKVEKTSQYDATSLYMNSHDLERLKKYIPPMVWLNYSPTTCDELKNGEIGVEMLRVKARF